MTNIETGYRKLISYDDDDFCSISTVSDSSIISSQNYTEYDLFVLKNNLQQWIYNTYHKKYQIIISAEQKDNSVNIIFFLSDGVQNIILTEQQKKDIQDVITRIINIKKSHILIYSYNSMIMNGMKFSEVFLRKFLPYIKISQKYEPIVDSFGIHINLRVDIDHNNSFEQLISEINEQLTDYYTKGVVLNPSEKIINDWKLTRYYSDTDIPLYYPEWTDNRLIYKYTTMSSFLTSRIQGEKYVYYKIGVNNFSRHYTAKLAKKFDLDIIFENEYVKLKIETLKLSQQIFSLIEDTLSNNGGEVFVLTYSRPYNIILNESIISDMKAINTNILDSISYKVSDQDNEYVFSVQIVVDSNYDNIIQNINKYKMILIKTMSSLKESNPETIISQKLGGEYKNISIYELIEQRWIENIPKFDMSQV